MVGCIASLEGGVAVPRPEAVIQQPGDYPTISVASTRLLCCGLFLPFDFFLSCPCTAIDFSGV